MLVISSREFRNNPSQYFDLVDNRENIVIQRDKNKSYKIIPITKDDMLMSKEEYYSMLERGLQSIKEGRGKEYTLDELRIKMGL